MSFALKCIGNAGKGIVLGVYTIISSIAFVVAILLWDLALTFLNIVTCFIPRRKGHVIRDGHPGAKGIWPQYIAPKEGDSRSSCPALNAMANHGVYFNIVICDHTVVI